MLYFDDNKRCHVQLVNLHCSDCMADRKIEHSYLHGYI